MRAPAILLALAACTGDIGDIGSSGNSVDQYIRNLPYLPVDPPAVVPGAKSAPTRSGDYQCTTENLQETRQYDRIVAYAANSDSLWPGALVSADSILTGLFTQVVMPRSPTTISVSLENLGGTKKATFQNASLATYRDALSGILSAEVTGSTPANLYSEIEQVHTQDQLNLALGVQASWGLGIASLKTSFNFSDTTVRSRYLVRYMQTYYTVDFDSPGSPSSVFSPAVGLSDVEAQMDPTRPPAYVSSVTYGRMVIFTFESQYSDEEMGAALDFAYSGGADVSGNVSVSYKDILSQSKITAYILGGDAGAAVQAIDSYDNLIAFIKSGGNYGPDSPGAPIAYKLNYLKDNSPARMSETINYDTQECTRVSQKVHISLDSIQDVSGGDVEVYGSINATGTDSANFFNKSSDTRVSISSGQEFGNPVADAIVDVIPSPGNSITLQGHLYSHRFLLSDYDLGNEQVVLPFEAGWRKQSTVTLTGSGYVVKLNFSLEPI